MFYVLVVVKVTVEMLESSVTHILLHTLISCEPVVITITFNFQRFTFNDNSFL